MAIKKWYSQPGRSFASFYYYNDETHKLVRIRMELDRRDRGKPKVIVSSNRYIGFGNEDAIDLYDDDVAYWCVNRDGKIYYQKEDDDEPVVFTNVPRGGLYVIDFSLDDDDDTSVHFGNRVTSDPDLPRCNTTDPAIVINDAILTAVAERYIAADDGVNICDYDDNQATLARNLEALSRAAAV